MSVMLDVADVWAGYTSGVDVLQGISLTVRTGSVTVVVGPNGAGKSTLLRTIFGFLKPRRGSIRLRDRQIASVAAHDVKRRGVGYIPQALNVFPLLTVEENLRMGAWTLRSDKRALHERLERIYATFPALAQRRRMQASQLSGGQARMLSVAREMIAEPEVLLVDEPTAGLAPNLVDQVYELLVTARERLGATILLVDQNVEEAMKLADEVYVINLGRVYASGPRDTFAGDRISEVIRECLRG